MSCTDSQKSYTQLESSSDRELRPRTRRKSQDALMPIGGAGSRPHPCPVSLVNLAVFWRARDGRVLTLPERSYVVIRRRT
jgi:hypothetical protein